MKFGIVPLEEILSLISAKPEALHLVLTGRDADQAVIDGGQPMRVTVSVGVAIHHPADPLPTPDLLIQRADHALYAAKESGRNRVVMA